MKSFKKYLTALIIFTYMLGAYSEDSSPVVYSELKIKDKDKTKDSTLEKMLSVDGVNSQYQKCIDPKNNVSVEDLSKCIWEGNGGSIPALDDQFKKKVKDLYAAESTPKNGSNGATQDLTVKTKNLNEDYMSDPSVIALTKVMEKKLSEAINGDDNFKKDKNNLAAVDHEKFSQIYKTELGKTILNSMISYCMEADIDNPKNSKEKKCGEPNAQVECSLYFLTTRPVDSNYNQSKKDIIEKNVKRLQSASLKDNSPDSKVWTSCINSISNICYLSPSGGDTDLSKESNKRACVIIDYIKSARKNMIAIDDQIAFYKDLNKEKSVSVSKNKNIDITAKNSIEAVATVTSKDIEDSFQVENKAVEKEIEDCTDGSQIKDESKCKKFLSTDSDDKKKALAEFGIRQYALSEKLDDKINKSTDKSEVEKYLKNEGYSADKINTMLTDQTKLDRIKKEITDRYKNERDALIADMAAKVSSKTTETNSFDKTKDLSKMQKIKEEIGGRAEELKQLVHFDNVVSSYITVEDTSTNTSKRNTASLNSELRSGATKFGNDSNQINNVKKQASEAGLVDDKAPKKNEDQQTDLSVETINKLLKYSTE